MEREAAYELVNEWNGLPGIPAGNAYHRLHALVRQLPDDVTLGAGTLVDGHPAVLAVTEGSLFVVTLEPVEDEGLVGRVRRLPLPDARTYVSLRDSLSGTLAGTERPAHTREWAFRWVDGWELTVATVVKEFSGAGDAPLSAERLARALAAHAGWALPT